MWGRDPKPAGEPAGRPWVNPRYFRWVRVAMLTSRGAAPPGWGHLETIHDFYGVVFYFWSPKHLILQKTHFRLPSIAHCEQGPAFAGKSFLERPSVLSRGQRHRLPPEPPGLPGARLLEPLRPHGLPLRAGRSSGPSARRSPGPAPGARSRALPRQAGAQSQANASKRASPSERGRAPR